MQPSFWRGKRVFLTGHTGFKGGWLSLWLASYGAKVVGYSLPAPTTPSLFKAARVADMVEHHVGDIRDYEKLKAALFAAKPDIVLHLAAQPLVRYSYDNPIETYATNVLGTVHLLEAVRQYGKAQVTMVVTSDKCYENREQIWSYRENDPMGGHDPYSNSKGCSELVVSSYGQSYFAVNPSLGRLGSGRAGNVVGGGDWALDRLVPDILRGLQDKQSPTLRRPKAMRPWQHVLEPLSGYIDAVEYLAAGNGKSPDAWNFGPNASSEVPVITVAETLCRIWGEGMKPVVQEDPNAVHEAGLLALDHTKARVEMGWQPRWNLETTLERTVEWHRAWLAGKDMQQVSLAQIQEYCTPSSTLSAQSAA